MMMNTAKMGAGNATYIDLLDKAVLSNTKQDEHHVTDFIDFLLVPTHLNSKTELIFYKGKVQNGDASYSSQFTIAPKNKDDDGLVFKNNFIEPYVNYTYQSTSHIVRDTPHLLVYQRHERLIKGRFPDKKPDFDTYLTLYPVYANGKSDFQKYQIKIKFEEKLYTKAYILGSIAFLICIGFFVLLSLLPIMVANRLILGSYPNVFLILTAILLYFYIIAFIYLDLTRGIDNAFYFRCILKTMIAIGFGGLMYHATQKP
jgi:hypothetical protein